MEAKLLQLARLAEGRALYWIKVTSGARLGSDVWFLGLDRYQAHACVANVLWREYWNLACRGEP